jgi:hypothetical protein
VSVEVVETRPVGACWECGYSLRGLPANRCPECGRPFDPVDETTMNMGRDVRGLVRWLMRPPGWPIHVLTGVAVVMSLWAAAVPVPRGRFVDMIAYMASEWGHWGGVIDWDGWRDWQSPYTRFLYGAVLWTMVIVCWVARRVARGVTVKRVAKQRAAPFAYWRRWLVVPVVFGLTTWVCTTRGPAYVGFWVSKPWLDRVAVDVGAQRGGRVYRRMVGIYPPMRNWVYRATYTPKNICVEIGREEILVYREDGTPPDDASLRSMNVRRLTGRWFLVDSFN